MPLQLHKKELPLWRSILSKNFVKLDPLLQFLEFSPDQQQYFLQRSHFRLNLPLRLAQKIEKGNLEDPLLKQFVPMVQELETHPDFVLDPLGEKACRKGPKLLHKYVGRVLIVCTSACAMHCRYCFRQQFDYEIQERTWAEEHQFITQDPSIQEVILSGGDPLSLGDEALERLLIPITHCSHVKRIRFHTRFPIGIPERIDESFLQLIEKIPQQIWFVLHINHPKELDLEILNRLKQLQRRGCVLLTQSVLLKEINDDIKTLKELYELLTNHGIMPYYLHQLDRIQGAAHFDVEEDQGRWLIQELTKVLPGYAVPKYVREIPGAPSKTPL